MEHDDGLRLWEASGRSLKPEIVRIYRVVHRDIDTGARQEENIEAPNEQLASAGMIRRKLNEGQRVETIYCHGALGARDRVI